MTSLASSRSFGGPVSQFQNLSKRVSSKSPKKPRFKTYENTQMSPREEIYKSMIREIRNGDVAQMNSLVHKASNVLRLSHYKDLNQGRNVTVSWDIDGRRVLTYEDMSGKKSMLQRQTSYDKKTKKNLLTSLTEPIFGLDSHNLKALSEYVDPKKGSNDGDLPTSKVSKVWEDYIDSGDVSKLWESKEGILTENPVSSMSSPNVGTRRRRSSATSTEDIDVEGRPPWKAFYRPPSSNYISSSRNSAHSMSSLPSMSSSRKTDENKKGSVSQSVMQEKEKADRIQHICVVNGSVVSFKNFGFENFTNWFGDDTTLEANQQRSQPKLHKEVDLTNVKSRDIKIRLLDGCKLEVEAKRRAPGTPKPIRMKESVLIPEGYRAEDLLICRTKAGKLVVEEVTPEPIQVKPVNSKVKSSKSKAKWRTSTK